MTQCEKRISLFHLPTMVNPNKFILSSLTLPEELLKAKYSSSVRKVNMCNRKKMYHQSIKNQLYSCSIVFQGENKSPNVMKEKILVIEEFPNIPQNLVNTSTREKNSKRMNMNLNQKENAKPQNLKLPKLKKKIENLEKKTLKPGLQIIIEYGNSDNSKTKNNSRKDFMPFHKIIHKKLSKPIRL